MQGVLPRTVAEFAASGRQVWVGCEECNRRKLVGNDVLEAMYGGEFDLYAGFAALAGDLRCEICGKANRSIIFVDAMRYRLGEVSADDALNRNWSGKLMVR